MISLPQAFYAYSSRPPHVGESIEEAIVKINQGQVAEFSSWRKLNTSGTMMISRITQEIDRAEIFAADLSSINPNVLFELGYAIGKERRIWLSTSGVEDSESKSVRKLDLLLPIGHSKYVNSHQLSGNLFRDAPWSDLAASIPLYRRPMSAANSSGPTLLYLQSPILTDASISLTQELDSSKLFKTTIADNPAEVPMESLDWYIQKVLIASAVVVHLLPKSQLSAEVHNAKCSLVAGIAHALGKPLFMLAHTPYDTPLDYQHMLKTDETAQQCKALAKKWLAENRNLFDASTDKIPAPSNKHTQALMLSEISVGEIVAEHETSTIDSYFVETGAFRHALEGRQTIFVGRKGTGKSANFYAVASRLQQDRMNHVCVVRPVAYELDGIVQLIRTASDTAERGYLVESVWKFLLLTELANSISAEVDARPNHNTPTSGETELIKFIEDNEKVFSPSFTVRLQTAVERILDDENGDARPNQRSRVSELLHDTVLSKLRSLLGEALRDRARVAILVDNLDTGWGNKDDSAVLSHFLLGLLEVAPVIEDQFRVGNKRSPSVNVTLAVFLRSDIFSIIQEVASEPDKTAYERITWSDKELLMRVIDSRLRHSTFHKLNPDQIWSHYFTPSIDGVHPKEYIADRVLSRPRDMIFFVREMLAHAVNHGHTRVEEVDINHAREEYSQYALKALIVEDDPRTGKLEAILYEFAGSSSLVSQSEVFEHFRNTGLSEELYVHYLNLLLDINFLGLPHGAFGTAEFPTDESVRKIKHRVATQISIKRGTENFYHIHRVFWPVLEVEEQTTSLESA